MLVGVRWGASVRVWSGEGDRDLLVRRIRDGYSSLSLSFSWSGLLTAGDVEGETMLFWGDTVGPSDDKTDPAA